MSNFPHDQDGAGDIKSLRRASWASLASNFLAVAGGRGYSDIFGDGQGWGNTKYNWDQPEGFMQRIHFHGTTEKPPFNALAGGQNGSINWQSQTGLTNLARTNSSGGITTGTTATVIKLANSDGASDEVYTNKFNNVSLDSVLAKTPADGQWYLSFYAKRGTRACTATVFIFGCAFDGSTTYSYNTGITPNIVDASSSTISSPATGGTSYKTTTPALTTSWVKYDMCFKFDGTSGLQAITCRLDNNNGNPFGDTEVFIDRLTLHPMNVAMSDVRPSFTGNANMDASIYGTYS
tara:strand:- start:47 stop:922 length:876 start_codon:yes stop_codon:yes gene_type:complete